jgi:tetratricopeptide (TPR) repeat protein
VTTSTPQECLIALGRLCGEDHGTEAVEAILSRHPEIMLSSQSHHHYKTGLLCDSTTSRIKCFNDAVESLRQALALSPNSISFALFHAVLLFKLAQNDAGSYDAVVQECDQALLIENPMEPGYEVPVQALRLEKIREGIVVVAKKSKRQIIVLEGGNRRDKWKRLVEDNSLAEVKAEFEATLRRKRRIPGRRAPPNFESPLQNDRLAKKKKNKKVESIDVATISRVMAFWNDKMSVKKKRKLLRIGIEDLKVYLDKNKFRMAKEVLTEAIDYAKAEKIWRFWACSYCGERVFVSDIDTASYGSFRYSIHIG